MIRYALVCEKEHGFDGWFRSSEDFETQAKRGLVTCPTCHSPRVSKALMAPSVATSRRREARAEAAPPPEVPAPPAEGGTQPVALIGEREQALREMIRAVREHVKAHATDVGERFAEVARQMHYGEAEHASIVGKASAEDAKALAEEGIEFHPLPVLPDEGN